MNDYKYMVIRKVREEPLLWDPLHSDYEDNDQRQQAWAKIDADLQPPREGMSLERTLIYIGQIHSHF